MSLSIALLLAEFTHNWPDGYDRVLIGVYLVVILGLPALGYFFMVLDFRRYLRSLRRALVVVARAVPMTPYWALRSRPVYLKTLGLELPYTEEELLAAYRDKAKALHPDRGGDLNEFLRLQKHFDEARLLLHNESPAAASADIVPGS